MCAEGVAWGVFVRFFQECVCVISHYLVLHGPWSQRQLFYWRDSGSCLIVFYRVFVSVIPKLVSFHRRRLFVDDFRRNLLTHVRALSCWCSIFPAFTENELKLCCARARGSNSELKHSRVKLFIVSLSSPRGQCEKRSFSDLTGRIVWWVFHICKTQPTAPRDARQ